jgi:hypothetical protein
MSGPSIDWLQRAIDIANADEHFRAATQWFDAWVLLAFGPQRFSLKLFMGGVIKIVPAAVPFGATFTLRGEAAVWQDLVTHPKNRFRELLASGAIVTEGNVFEALRATKAVALLIEALRRAGAWTSEAAR